MAIRIDGVPLRLALTLIWSIALTLSACGQAPPAAVSSPAADASAGSSGAGRVPGAKPVLLDPISVIGTWSFDRTCASGDGMQLEADGRAGFDEWGRGMWAVDVDHRIVLILRESEPGKDEDPLSERRVLVFTPTAVAGDDLKGRFAPSRPGEAAREINAKRCPAAP